MFMRWNTSVLAICVVLHGVSHCGADTLLAPTVLKPDDYPVLGVYCGGSGETFNKAVELGFDYMFPSVFWYEETDWLKGMVERAHERGVKICPSFGTAYDGYGERKSDFAAAHPEWFEIRRNGDRTDHGAHLGLSFGVPEVRQHKVKVFAQRVRDYNLDGITLDYTRFFERTCGYHPSIVDAFKAETGRDAAKIPNKDAKWKQFRANYVTKFVRELRAELDTIATERGRPVELLACSNADPHECMDYAMQDWQAWVDEGLVDGMVTMIYKHDANEVLRQVQVANEACRGKVWHMPMIAPYDWYITSDEQLLDQSLKALKTGTNALAFYRDDFIFKYELWDSIEQVSKWTRPEIQRQPINYLQNPGFELALENWAIGLGEHVERVEHDGGSRTGQAALRFTGPAELRQIIDRGFLGNPQSMTISLWTRAGALAAGTQLFVDVSVNSGKVNSGKGAEAYYRVPVTLADGNDWQQFEVRLPLDPTRSIEHILLGIVAEGSEADLLVDDLAVSLSDQPADSPGDYKISSKQASKNWQPATDNLVRGQLVSGSSFWEKGTEYDNAVDGDFSAENYSYGAAWVSQRPGQDQWILIALPASKRISRIRLMNNTSQAAYRTNEFSIELSNDGRRFRKVADGGLPDDGVTWTERSFKPQHAKYIRFNGITGFNLEYAVGLLEIEAFEE